MDKLLIIGAGGFGVYLDMYLNDPTNKYYFPPVDGSRLAHLQKNLLAARDAADEYVWVYGEQCRWWNVPVRSPNSAGRGWEDAMPGITRTIDLVRDPPGAARTILAAQRQAGTLTNLAINGEFSVPAASSAGALPRGFSTWQDNTVSNGRFAWDGQVGGGSGRAAGVYRGCFIQTQTVKGGEMYAVSVSCLPQGRSFPTLMIRWQTSGGRWTQLSEDRTFAFVAGPADWQTAFGVVSAPPGAGRMVILLNVAGQVSDSDICHFDNLEVYCINRW